MWGQDVMNKNLINLAKNNNKTNIALIMVNKAEFIEQIEEIKKDSSINVVFSELFNPDTTDFRSILTKLKETNANSIIFMGYDLNVINFLKQQKEIGLDKEIIFLSKELQDIEDIKSYLDSFDTVYSAYYFSNSNSKSWNNFENKFYSKYSEKPPVFSSYVYDDLMILAESLKICDSENFNKECIISNILNTTHEGTAGKIQFDKDGNSIRGINIEKFYNSSWVKEVS